MKKKFLLISTTRADYGLLKRILFLLKKEQTIDTKLLVCGSHFNKKFGNTYKEILKDKFQIDFKINIDLKGDKPNNLNQFLIGHTKKLDYLLNNLYKPDLLIVLGDRFEVLSTVFTSFIYSIPICHLHAGETTKGSADEKVRHAISKLSSIFFVSHKINQKNLIKMGIEKNKIFNFGALGLNDLKRYNIKKNLIEKKLNISLKKKTFIITYHPETISKTTKENFKSLLKSLEKLNNINLIFTSPNIDEEHNIIFNELKNFINKNKNAIFVKSLGKNLYFSLLKYVDCVIGNSSSGIIEVPSFNIPTINIGNRQKGRLQSKTIFNCKPKTEKIYFLIKKILNKNIKFKGNNNIYKKNKTEEKIVSKLKKINFTKLKKNY